MIDLGLGRLRRQQDKELMMSSTPGQASTLHPRLESTPLLLASTLTDIFSRFVSSNEEHSCQTRSLALF